MRAPARPLAVLAFVAAAAASPAAARADMTVELRPGQAFAGDVPAGEPLRITVELAKDADLRLEVVLRVSGATPYFPANFQRVAVTDAEGKPVPFDQRLWTDARYSKKDRSSRFYVRGWKAPAGGAYTFTIRHRTTVATRCSGRAATVRPLRTRFDETTGPTVSIPVQADDQTHVTVTRRSGGAPWVESYQFTPGGSKFAPPQRRTRTGSTTQKRAVGSFGAVTYTIGPRDPEAPLERYRGTLVLTKYGRYGRAALDIATAPGVPVEVRNPDAFLDLPWATGPCGISWSGAQLLVTGETGGAVRGKLYEANLTDPDPYTGTTELASPGDLTGLPIAGHRTVHCAGAQFVAYSAASGASVAVSRFPDRLDGQIVRDGFVDVASGSPWSLRDFFVAADDYTVTVGTPAPPNGHTILQIDAATSLPVGPAFSIGNAAQPFRSGASAVYRRDQNVFEFWAPSSDVVSTPGDLNHGLFSPSWSALSWEPARVAEAGINETMCSSVVLDEETGATIVHYVEPTLDQTGLGTVHRRVFDVIGNEVPNSHATLGAARRNRPVAVIVGNHLLLGLEGPANPSVTAYQLLR